MTRAPAWIRFSNPITSRLLRIGMPMGPNVLMTVRGRSSGQPRTAPVAILEYEGRRLIIGAYGETHWVRNLRAAGEADIHAGGRTEHVTATELDRAGATAIFRDALPGRIARLPGVARVFIRALFRLVAPEMLGDPERAAASRPIFELTSAPREAR